MGATSYPTHAFLCFCLPCTPHLDLTQLQVIGQRIDVRPPFHLLRMRRVDPARRLERSGQKKGRRIHRALLREHAAVVWPVWVDGRIDARHILDANVAVVQLLRVEDALAHCRCVLRGCTTGVHEERMSLCNSLPKRFQLSVGCEHMHLTIFESGLFAAFVPR